jgi:hypothetical protein
VRQTDDRPRSSECAGRRLAVSSFSILQGLAAGIASTSHAVSLSSLCSSRRLCSDECCKFHLTLWADGLPNAPH